MLGSTKKYSSPSGTGNHPEMDTSRFLNDQGHRKYQMLIRMLVWVIIIGRIGVTQVTSSLSRFTACPRDGHINRLLRVLGYFKKRPSMSWIVDDSWDPIYREGKDALGIMRS
jgi:hypothetical protein